jgi:hypothetical protein
MNYIYAYSIQTYEKQILHDYYCQIVTHEICDVNEVFFCWMCFVTCYTLTKILNIQSIPTNMNQKKLDSKWINKQHNPKQVDS